MRKRFSNSRSRVRRLPLPPEPVYSHPSRPAWLYKSPVEIPLVFFDFETTGGNPQNSGITEIAAIKYINGQEVGRFQTLVNPERPIPRMVQKITGIDNAMVRNAPKIAEVFDEFVAFIGDGVLISHGAIGDVAYITHNFAHIKQAKFLNYYICTHLLVANFLPNIPSKTLGGVANYFGIPPVDVHRAMADAELTAGVFWKIYDVCERNDHKTIEDLLKIQADNETLRRLGSGVLASEVEERAPSVSGIFYLFNPARELVYMAATNNLKRRLLNFTNLGDEREFNRLIADVSDFKIERSAHYLGALLKEKEVLQKLTLPIDPRKFEGRNPQLIQVLIPEDLLEYRRSYSDNVPLEIPDEILDRIDDVLPVPQALPLRRPQKSGDSAASEEVALEPVPIRKTRKTVLGSSSKFKMLRTPKPPSGKLTSNGLPPSYFSIGALANGVGWYFGPFDPTRNPRKHFDDLLTELPFHDKSHPVAARLNYLHLFVAALSGRLDAEIESVMKLRSSKRFILRPLQRHRLSQLAKRLEMLKDLNFDLPRTQLPRSGLAVITNPIAKEFDIYVVVCGRVRKEITIVLEDSDKLRSRRFVTRLFHDYHDELVNPSKPFLFTDSLCSDIELFAGWYQHRKNEGEWIDFEDIAPLYDPDLL